MRSALSRLTPTQTAFAKFVLVGCSTLLIDAGLHWVLMYHVPGLPEAVGREVGPPLGIAPHLAAFAVLRIPTTALSIANSYYWNRRWTFRAAPDRRQAARFWTVSLSAMLVNWLTAFTVQLTVHSSSQIAFAGTHLAAAFVATIFNFTGQRLWTFRVQDAESV